ncbi:TIGR03089 family protein [Saccharopolyspora sp. CA-218241]|uniref:TIGR03089 family protein n=1 Tax=Saccharopolyspora sp. CA-218241 TaxID=3240027 RepID=UPI003D991B4A
MSATQELLGPVLAGNAAKPLITYYDDATGARVELSGATTANWAAKTANWLVDELDVEPGTPVAVDLPAHWQTAGVLLGAWWCGAHVVDDPDGAELAVVAASDPARGEGARTVAAVGLDALGAPVRDLPDGVLDYATEIRVHGDDFSPLLPVPADTPALLGHSAGELVAAARERAAGLGLSAGDRVLSTVEWTLPGGVLDGLLAVLAAGASLVHCAHADPALLERRRADERTTARLA